MFDNDFITLYRILFQTLKAKQVPFVRQSNESHYEMNDILSTL